VVRCKQPRSWMHACWLWLLQLQLLLCMREPIVTFMRSPISLSLLVAVVVFMCR